MVTKKKKAAPNGTAPATPRQGLTSNVFIPEPMLRRLSEFMLAKYAGRAHMRNTVILEALDRMLTKEGF